MKNCESTMNDKLLLFFDNAKSSFYELICCDDLETFDFWCFDFLDRVDWIIKYKEKLIKRSIKYKKWKDDKYERI